MGHNGCAASYGMVSSIDSLLARWRELHNGPERTCFGSYNVLIPQARLLVHDMDLPESLAFFNDIVPFAHLFSPVSSAYCLLHRRSLPLSHPAPSYQPDPASFLRKSSKPARHCTVAPRSMPTTLYLRKVQRPLRSPTTSIIHPIGIPSSPWLLGLRRLLGLHLTRWSVGLSFQARTR